MYQRADVEALRRAANRNLTLLADGTIRRQEALRRANERRAKERRKEERREMFAKRRDLKTNIKLWQKELNELQTGYQYLYDAYNAGTIDQTEEGMGGLEEIDHMIDTLAFKISDAIEELAFMDDWVR